MEFLNYHHLRYFRVIAGEGNLTRAARSLNLSPPALSVQLRQLEESLGHTLFERLPTGLELTEAGRVALDYADSIGRAGEELMDVMRHRVGPGRQMLRVGAVATLSRNFQLEFLKPAMHRADVELVLRSGSLSELIVSLQAHQVDVVLSNEAVRRDAERPWHSHRLADQAVSLVGAPEWKAKRLKFPRDFDDVPLVLPSFESNTRAAFDRLLASAGVRPRVMAEVDDMAMLRLLAREGEGLALVPPVVVQDEIASGALVVTHRIAEIRETFHAVTPSRRFPNPLVGELIEAMAAKGMRAPRRKKASS
ncbi:LysR family transcriptional regulator [Haloferula helveola]|uniref:LysR family transcriptional regulator n=1 Tax=Haloferula helveola TaxID=490095 RepID=A0ABM7RE13_9BACT|nr:LysR family transcriptional regulator [Haloferula helveola]